MVMERDYFCMMKNDEIARNDSGLSEVGSQPEKYHALMMAPSEHSWLSYFHGYVMHMLSDA